MYHTYDGHLIDADEPPDLLTFEVFGLIDDPADNPDAAPEPLGYAHLPNDAEDEGYINAAAEAALEATGADLSALAARAHVTRHDDTCTVYMDGFVFRLVPCGA